MAEFLITLPTRIGDVLAGGSARLPAFVTDPRRDVADGSFAHLAQAGRAAELAAFHGALAPFDPEGAESFVVAADLLRHSRWLRAVAEFHPGLATPVYAAKLSASLQRFSGDRLDWKPAVDLDPARARAQGDFVTGPDRYARAEEFLTVAKGVWSEPGYTYQGRFYQVLAGGFEPPLSGRKFPRVFLSGTTPEALALSARHADVHVFAAGDDLAAGITALRGLAAGRADGGPAYGLTLPVLAREDDEEARRAGPPPSPGLAGSYGTVAAGIRDHIERGVTTFILESRPAVEETYRLGEHLLPLLGADGARRKEAVHAD